MEPRREEKEEKQAHTMARHTENVPVKVEGTLYVNGVCCFCFFFVVVVLRRKGLVRFVVCSRTARNGPKARNQWQLVGLSYLLRREEFLPEFREESLKQIVFLGSLR